MFAILHALGIFVADMFKSRYRLQSQHATYVGRVDNFCRARDPYAINLAMNYAPGACRPSRSGPCGDVRYYAVMCLPSVCRTMAFMALTKSRRELMAQASSKQTAS